MSASSSARGLRAEGFPKPYAPPCTERGNVFAFTQKPSVKLVGRDRYEITFAVKGYCDVAAGIIDREGKVHYVQLVEEITEEPDYDAALAALDAL